MRAAGLAVLLGSVCGLGCGSGSPAPPPLPPLVPVSGTVHDSRGKPLAGVVVVFHPQFDMGGVKFTPTGKTAADGTFTLSSGTDGAPVGAYVVTFTHPELTDPGDAGSAVDRWRGRYGDPVKSRVKVTVKDGDNRLDPFRLD